MRISKLVASLSKSRFFFTLLILSIIFGSSYFAISYAIAKIQTFTNTLEIGFVGQPLRINPLWSKENPIDEMLTNVIYRGLISFDPNGNPIGDLAELWSITEDQKGYRITLKPDQYWQDGVPITASDVVFTYKLTQEEIYQGPEKLRFKDVFIENTDDRTVLFTLKEPFSPFLESLTMPVLPKHLWENTSYSSIRTSKHNLNPVGSTQFKIVNLNVRPKSSAYPHDQVKDIEIENTHFGFQDTSYKRIILRFYDSEEELTQAYQTGHIDRFITSDIQIKNSYTGWKNTSIRNINLDGQILSLFFNLENKNSPVNDENFRSAFRTALNQSNTGLVCLTLPINKDNWAYDSSYTIPTEDENNLANSLKLEQPITLVSADTFPEQQIAQDIVTYFTKLNLKIKLEVYPANDIRNNILPERKFDLFLAKLKLGFDPDQYSFWHSTQTNLTTAGQNISGFSERQTDKALEDGRKNFNRDERIAAYHTFEKRLFENIPAVFISFPVGFEISRINLATDTNPYTIWDQNDYLHDILGM